MASNRRFGGPACGAGNGGFVESFGGVVVEHIVLSLIIREKCFELVVFIEVGG